MAFVKTFQINAAKNVFKKLKDVYGKKKYIDSLITQGQKISCYILFIEITRAKMFMTLN